MNARQQLKPKTIRLAILLALTDGAITTIDDLQTKIDEPRKKVAGAVYPAATEGLIKRMRDDVTGGPAYQITAAGREYLAKYSGSVEEPAGPVIKESLTTESGTAIATKDADFPTFHEPTVSDIIGAMTFGYHGSNEPPPGHWLTEFHQRGAADAWKDGEIVRLASELAATKASLELSRLARAVTSAGYVTQRPGKPLERFTKAESAQVRAMSAARAGKRAQVFALVPVGAAMPGAEWVAA